MATVSKESSPKTNDMQASAGKLSTMRGDDSITIIQPITHQTESVTFRMND
jgi:hypothetical protein